MAKFSVRTKHFDKLVTDTYFKYGLSYPELGRLFNTNQATIRNVAKTHNWLYNSAIIARGVWTFTWTYKLEIKAAKLAKQIGYKETSERLNCSVFELVAMLVSNKQQIIDHPDYKLRRSFLTETKKWEIYKLYITNKFTYKELAVQFSCNHLAVKNIMIEYDEYETRTEKANKVDK